MLRSEIHLDLGNIAQAAAQADLAQTRWEALDFSALPPPLAIPKVIGPNDPGGLMRTACESSPAFGPHKCGRREFGDVDIMASAAIAFALNKEPEKARKIVSKLESWAESTLLKLSNKQAMAKLRAALSRIHMAQKNYDQALAYADQDDRVISDIFNIGFFLLNFSLGGTVGGDNLMRALQSQHTLQTKFRIAHARVEVGRLADAKTHLEEVLGQEEIKALPGIYWAALHDRGRIAESENKPDEAIALYQRAVEEIERQRSTINTENAKIGFFGDKQAVYQDLIRLLFDSGRHEDAFLMGERSKSRALVDMLAGKQDFRIAGPDADKVRQLLNQSQVNEVALTRDTTIDRELAASTVRKFQDKAEIGTADVTAVINDVRNLKAEARETLNTQAPELASLISVSSVSLAEIRRILPADQSLLSYHYDSRNLYAFIIDSAGFQAVKLERAHLEEAIDAYRRLIEDRSAAHQESGKALHDRLIAPLLPYLRQPKLLIAGHGKLHYLPFAALFDGKSYLIDRHELTYLPSASTLKFIGTRQAAGKSGSLLALGNPDLGDRRYDLPYAEKEAQVVASIFPGSALLLKKDASKRKLKEYGAGFTYLHFATHGKFDADNPLGSALMLAGNSANDEADRLTVGELYSMSLDADLVTLSACETGLGKVANGDDVVGLVRGFLYAGTNQVVSTLWPIDDEATSSLMATFYGNLKTGQKKAQALRDAQISLRGKYPQPFFWAAFQMTAGR
jgi:CHAT domain-containing protein/predicted negative regulator of RcsB-dependent stress response